MTENVDSIREVVRDHYAAQAHSTASCCGDNELYNPDMLTELPAEVVNFSLGCGDPITLAGLQPGETVLDLGSGGGLDCFLAAKKVGETGKVIGVDMTPEMLTRARDTALRLGATNVEFRQGYLEDLPVEGDCVDVVISNCVINLSPDKESVFREVFRVLKPGGRVSVADVLVNGELPESIKNDPQSWSACVAGAISTEEYVSSLASAGFTDITVRPKEEGVLTAGMPYSGLIMARKP